MMALISLVFALILAKFFLPIFNRLIGENLTLKAADPVLMVGALAILLFSGLAAGVFPAFYLSSLNPTKLLKGWKSRKPKYFSFRKVLIVVQFSISVFLIVCALTASKQTAFIKNADLGFTQDQVVLVPLKGDLRNTKTQTFKEILLRDPRILEISFASQEPGNITNTNTWLYQGKEYPMKVLNTDPEYLTLMELELLSGRNFKREMRTDIGLRYLINQKAAESMEMDSPVGETVRANQGNSEIIGLIKDYHFNSLHNRIEPLAICWYERWANIAHIKIAGEDITSALQHINQTWIELSPDFPFSYSFLDESFAKKYQKENRLTEILVYFVTLAILLSCLGLLGLSAFVAEQKTKEIGIRKVMGSSDISIIVLLSKDFSKWVVFSNFFAWPVAYLVAAKWLQNYAYRINPSLWTFVLSAAIALIIALFTVSFQSIKAATANPIDCLRYE